MQRGYLSIDLGPSRLAAGVLDLNGHVMVRDRVATPARNVWPALTQLVGRVLAANPSEVEPRSAGVTCPGPIDRMTGAMKPVGMPLWHDFPLRRELAALTDLPVTIDTAGRGLALAELWSGETAQRPPHDRHVAVLALGDVVDGALVTGGVLAEGTTGNLGQFGHLIVEPGGARCRCGAEGCLDAYAGALAIEESTGRELRRTPPAIIERTGIMVARACAAIAAMGDPTDIIVGGIVPTVLGEPLFEALDREFEQRSGLEHLADIRVRPAGNRVGPLLAAAAVARHSGRERTDADVDEAATVSDDATTGSMRRPRAGGVAPTRLAAEAVAGPRVRIAPSPAAEPVPAGLDDAPVTTDAASASAESTGSSESVDHSLFSDAGVYVRPSQKQRPPDDGDDQPPDRGDDELGSTER